MDSKATAIARLGQLHGHLSSQQPFNSGKSQIIGNNNFRCVGKDIYMLLPEAKFQDSTDASVHPKWVSHLNKLQIEIVSVQSCSHFWLDPYARAYEQIYPSSTKPIIPLSFSSLCTSTTGTTCLHTSNWQILGFLPESKQKNLSLQSSPSLLIHALSHGGCCKLICLSRLLASHFPNLQLNFKGSSAIIFDSAPGTGSKESWNALESAVIRHYNPVHRGLIKLMVTIIYLYSSITHRKLILEALRDDLHDTLLLPWLSDSSPRLYLYSHQDRVISFKDMEMHIREAKLRGLKVRDVAIHSR